MVLVVVLAVLLLVDVDVVVLVLLELVMLELDDVIVLDALVEVVVSQSSVHTVPQSDCPACAMHVSRHRFLHIDVVLRVEDFEVVEDDVEVSVSVVEVIVLLVDVRVDDVCVAKVRVDEVLVNDWVQSMPHQELASSLGRYPNTTTAPSIMQKY